MKGFDVEIKDQPFDPDSNDKSIYYFERKGDGRLLYKVFIYAVGQDLPFVNKITYHLHETFPNPVREVFRTDANPNCKLVTWAWGKFPMRVVVQDRKGNTYELTHFLLYDRYFSRTNMKKHGLHLVNAR